MRRRRADNSREHVVKKSLRRKKLGRDRKEYITPIMIREGKAVMPLRQRTRGKPRRRHDVPLGVPGAELRLPSLPRIRFSWRWISGFLVALMATLLYYGWNAPTYRVQVAEISGSERLTSKEINLVLGISGASIFTLDPAQMQRDLRMAFPEFSRVEVQVGLPDKVFVNVRERNPVLSWHWDDRTVWVDAEGVAFPARGEAEHLPLVKAFGVPQLPLQEETDSDRLLSPEMVLAILAVSRIAPQGAKLLFDPEHGLGWKDPEGWQAYFGMNEQDMDAKLLVYQSLVTHFIEEDIHPRVVSVEYLHAPYYRMER